MAQNFKNYIQRNIGTSGVDLLGGATNSIDCLISVRLANTTTSTITVEVYIERGGSNYFLIKNAPIVSGGSLELIDGGSKIVLASGDQLYAKSDTASSSAQKSTNIPPTLSDEPERLPNPRLPPELDQTESISISSTSRIFCSASIAISLISSTAKFPRARISTSAN